MMNEPLPYVGQFHVKKNSAAGRPVLYLDFDGVLHPEEVYLTRKGIVLRAPGHQLFENVPILEALLEPHPEVRIVLSTAWVTWRGFEYCRERLSKPLHARVIGATYHKRYMRLEEFRTMSRGLQIWADTQRRAPGGWVSLDDDWFGWPAWCRDRLVRCPGDIGIASPDVQQALKSQLEGLATMGQGLPRTSISA